MSACGRSGISIAAVEHSGRGEGRSGGTKPTQITVEPRGDSWVVRQGPHVVCEHHTKSPAVQSGMRQAHTAHHSQLIIKKQNGRIQEERTYGQDPFPPKG